MLSINAECSKNSMPVVHACILRYLKLETTSSQKTSCRTHKCQTASFLATGGFVKLFHKIPWFFHDYTGFYKFHDFSMHGTFLVIFQFFHEFQSLWEPCIMDHTGKNNLTVMNVVGSFQTVVLSRDIIYIMIVHSGELLLHLFVSHGWKFKISKILNFIKSEFTIYQPSIYIWQDKTECHWKQI